MKLLRERVFGRFLLVLVLSVSLFSYMRIPIESKIQVSFFQLSEQLKNWLASPIIDIVIYFQLYYPPFTISNQNKAFVICHNMLLYSK